LTVERDDVLRIAAGLMCDAGAVLDGSRVATTAGVDHGLLRQWFPTDADLECGVFAWYADLVCASPARFATLADVGSWADEQVVSARLRESASSYGFAVLVGRTGPDRPVRRDAIGEVFQRWASALMAGLRRVQRSGELSRDADPGALADLLLSSLQGGLLLARIHGDTRRLEVALRGALATVASMCTDATTRRTQLRLVLSDRPKSV
jgi:TetR/AcrR family transcriptional repressor of nem operon